MNWRHLQAVLWLRWRLSVNQWRRAGRLNFVLMTILAAAAVGLAIPLFIGVAVGGWYGFAEANPDHLLFAWDVVVVAFLILWCMGLLSDVQRSDNLSMAKFLHLPVSVRGVFAINYVSSLVSLTMVLSLPIMLGLCLGVSLAQGPRMLLTFPLTAAFLLMISALTYQFQGWLASLMTNPRRRRAVVVGLTMAFVLVFQLPNLLNFARPGARGGQAAEDVQLSEEMSRLQQEFQAQKIDLVEFERRRQQAIENQQREKKRAWEEKLGDWQRMARIGNLVLPIGWLPLGVMKAAEGQWWAGALATLAMSAIGAGSLWRGYRTTVRMHQGHFTTGRRRPASVRSATDASTAAQSPAERPAAGKGKWRMLEARLPMVSEPAAAVALAGFRSLLRSPEVKMLALMPLLFGLVFGVAGLRNAGEIPVSARPLIVAGGMVFVLFMWLQVLANQFGFDRDGFRIFVLCGAPRRAILLGKNLAVAPLPAAMCGLMLIVVEIAAPLRFGQLLAMPFQFVSMFLLFCVLGNLVSIFAPMAMAAGSLKPTSAKLWPVLLQMLAMLLALPLLLMPTFLPLGVEPLLEALDLHAPLPVGLFLTVALCAAIVFMYRACLNWQGDLLQRREQKILECVTGRAA